MLRWTEPNPGTPDAVNRLSTGDNTGGPTATRSGFPTATEQHNLFVEKCFMKNTRRTAFHRRNVVFTKYFMADGHRIGPFKAYLR